MTITTKQVLAELAELVAEFKGNTTPYARGYRAALREARGRIKGLSQETKQGANNSTPPHSWLTITKGE